MKRGQLFAFFAATMMLGLAACGGGGTTTPTGPTTIAEVLQNVGGDQFAYFFTGATVAFADGPGGVPCSDALLYTYRVHHEDGSFDEYLKVSDPGVICPWLADFTEQTVCHGTGTFTWSTIPNIDPLTRMSVVRSFASWTGATTGPTGEDDQCAHADKIGPATQWLFALHGTGVSGDSFINWTQIASWTEDEPATVFDTVPGPAFPHMLCDNPGVIGTADHVAGHGYCAFPADQVL